MEITKGYKYRIYPTKEQCAELDHQCFIYNQAYNICLDIQHDQWNKNKDLDKKDRVFIKATEMDRLVKQALKQRNLPFKTVVTQQARINTNRALEQALKNKNKGFPKFKNSKFAKQSFNWNNQGYKILETDNPKFKIFRLMKMSLKMRYHRELPDDYKLNQITVVRHNNKYYIALSITYNKNIHQKLIEDIQLDKSIGIDININNFALSNGELIKTLSKETSFKKYDKQFKRLQRKQSRRLLYSKQKGVKLGSNFKKIQQKINKLYEKSVNIKQDNYHKITEKLTREFDLIAVEALQVKNMTKHAHSENVKVKTGLNKSILNTSFYQFSSQLEYKAKHNGKLFVKIEPKNTSKTCHVCGSIKDNLTLKDRQYLCEYCGIVIHRDINASLNILNLGYKSFGLGISLEDYKLKAFRVS